MTPYEPQKVAQRLAYEIEAKGFAISSPLYLRIFKETSELEIWRANSSGTYALFKTYPICTFSGTLGPKLLEGDNQAPEGFYSLTARSLNPKSRFHLAMNVGYPNAYDRAHGRTGDYIMVHGNCVSIGCFAMGDAPIEEIYTQVKLAFRHGQGSIPIHIFPFRLTVERLAAAQKDKWYSFWQELAPAYGLFEQTRQVPKVIVVVSNYKVLTP
ncbi:MAG: murein L,D-transpeptidase [Alphaproteobacteria bacterium]|nr:murein L,D-transpeptidase [Alphaproteobacteria bacterium]